MLKKSLIVVGAVALLAVLFLGLNNTLSWVKLGWNKAQQAVKENTPVSLEIERLRQDVKDLDGTIRKNDLLIAQDEVKLARLEKQRGEMQDNLAARKEAIQRLKGDLDSDRASYVYAGKTYSRSFVQQDLKNRFEGYKTAEGNLQLTAKNIELLTKGLEAAKQAREKMLANQRQLALEIEQLQVRLKNVELAKSTDRYNYDDTQLSDISKRVEELSGRLAVEEQVAANSLRDHELIPLEEAEATENISDEITKYFEQGEGKYVGSQE